MTRRLPVLLFVVLCCLATPARAQVPPPPEQATPVLEVIAPTVSPACGNAVLVVAIAPGLVSGQTGGALPIEVVTPAIGPVFVVCGAVPAPPARLTCDADATLNSTANSIAGAIAGTQLPVGVDPFGSAVEQAIVLQDTLPPPASTTGALDQVVATLNCKAATAPIVPPAPANAPVPDDAGFDEAVLGDELTLAPLFDTLTPDVTAVTAPPDNAPVVETPAQQVGAVGFAYPVVFALPLVLLVLGGYLGRALTQPVGAPHRRVSELAAGTTHADAELAKVKR